MRDLAGRGLRRLRAVPRPAVAGVAAALFLGTSSVALGLPWDVDMVDTQMVKGYERVMPGLPAGVVAQPNIASPKGYAPNFRRESPEGQALVNPLPDDEATRLQGKVMMETYCAPCHGADGIVLGPVAAPGRVPGVVPLAGPAGISRLRTDGWLYLTIRNGGAIMPNYNWAMSDDEMWSIVRYLRTLPNAQQPPPAPVTP
jgi:mono/diheme cytochrome c family protein